MPVPPLEQPGPVNPAGLFAPGGSAAGSTKAAEDKEMFLNLMVAQLRYQDPSNPADMGQFMAQNAQFQALEKMQEVADATTALMTQQMAFGAAGLVGREVTWPDDQGQLVRGTVGAVSFSADGPVLDVAGHSVAMNQVQAVGTPRGEAAPPAPGGPATGGPTTVSAAPPPSSPSPAPTQPTPPTPSTGNDTSARDTRVVLDPDAAVITETPDQDPGVLL